MSQRALIAVGLALLAAPISAQTAGTPSPTGLWAAQTAANQITLVWTGSAGATGYVLYRDAGASGSQAKVATLAGNVRRYVFVVRSAAQDVQQFHLEATGAGGSSPKVPFNPVTLVSGPVPPVAPASVTATVSSATVITCETPAALARSSSSNAARADARLASFGNGCPPEDLRTPAVNLAPSASSSPVAIDFAALPIAIA